VKRPFWFQNIGLTLSIGRNSSYNLIGSAIPLILSLFTVPLYLRSIGSDRYGVLAIAWLLLGYFGLFDLGLGRATSFRIAASRESSPQQRADTFWAALAVNSAMGVLGGAILWLASGYFFSHLFKVSDNIRPEIMESLPLLALSVPIATLTGVLTGSLQGRERFVQVNLISAGSTILFQLVPLAIAFFYGPRLFHLLEGALLVRIAALGWLMFACHRCITRGSRLTLRLAEADRLLRYGGWVTIASLFGPILYLIDRLAIGALLNAAAVTIYTIPLQLAQRITIVPSALTTALFPRMSASSEEDQNLLSQKATRTLCSIMTFPVVAAIFLIGPFISVWLGPDMASKAAPIGRILILGMWGNSLALVPFNQLQARGRPDLVTKIQLSEIPPYVAGLFFGLREFGLFGCAVVQALRYLGDLLCLTLVAKRRTAEWPLLAMNFPLLLLAVACASEWPTLGWAWLATAVAIGGFTAILGWSTLPDDSRQIIFKQFSHR
jgi:O-antigen/teichoic acid export membrane protein